MSDIQLRERIFHSVYSLPVLPVPLVTVLISKTSASSTKEFIYFSSSHEHSGHLGFEASG